MTTETLVMVIWTIGLAGALLLTLIILKEVRLVVGALTAIHFLARRTGTAAQGIARHLEPVSALPEVLDSAGPLLDATGRLRAASAAFQETSAARLGPGAAQRAANWLVGWITGRRD